VAMTKRERVRARFEGRDGLLAILTWSSDRSDYPWMAAETRFTDGGARLRELLERIEPLDLDRDADYDRFRELRAEILALEPRIVWERDRSEERPVDFHYRGGILRWR